MRERFLTEAEITSQLQHPGIVPIYALEEEVNGQPIMPCVSWKVRRSRKPYFLLTNLNNDPTGQLIFGFLRSPFLDRKHPTAASDRHYRMAISISPEYTASYALLGQALSYTAPREVEMVLRSGLAHDARNFFLHNELLRAIVGQSLPEEGAVRKAELEQRALQQVDAIRALQAEPWRTALLLAAIYARVGRTDDAVAQLEQATQLAADDDIAVAHVAAAQRELAEWLMTKNHRPREALALLNRAWQTYQSEQFTYFMILPKVLGVRGNAYLELGDAASALRDHDEMIRLEPRAGTYCIRAQTYLAVGDYPRALADLDQAARLPFAQPWFIPAFRGTIWAAQGEWEKAEGQFQEALKLDVKEETRRWAGLGMVLLQRGKTAEAAKVCRDTYERLKESVEVATVLEMTLLCCARKVEGMDYGALARRAEATLKSSGTARALAARCLALHRADRGREALDELERALAARKESDTDVLIALTYVLCARQANAAAAASPWLAWVRAWHARQQFPLKPTSVGQGVDDEWSNWVLAGALLREIDAQ